jgi:hypothetical protein
MIVLTTNKPMTSAKIMAVKEHPQQTIELTTTQTTVAERPVLATPAPSRDRFAAAEYVNLHARLPRIQALRGENGSSECGYFITESEMAKAGWRQIDAAETIVYEYNSGVRFV